MVQQLCQVTEVRLRLDAFVSGHASMDMTGPAESAGDGGCTAGCMEGDPILMCFLDQVAELLRELTRQVQLLPGKVKRQRGMLRHSHRHVPITAASYDIVTSINHSRIEYDTCVHGADGEEDAVPLSLMELCLYSTPLHASLMQLASLCSCTAWSDGRDNSAYRSSNHMASDAQIVLVSSPSGVKASPGGSTDAADACKGADAAASDAGLALVLAPSMWEVEGFPQSTALLTRLHGELVEVGWNALECSCLLPVYASVLCMLATVVVQAHL